MAWFPGAEITSQIVKATGKPSKRWWSPVLRNRGPPLREKSGEFSRAAVSFPQKRLTDPLGEAWPLALGANSHGPLSAFHNDSELRPLVVDGKFGGKTEERVREFQRRHGLSQDGRQARG
jgi:peptidoglycan hydrolase-like protein with peptidoglycan-binding domain